MHQLSFRLGRRLALLVGVGLVSLALASAAQAKDQIWWANQGGSSLAHANLDGSGGSDFGAGGASVNAPSGTGFDLRTNRVYWIDNGVTPKIKWATLNGSAHGILNTTGAAFNAPQGLVVDAAARKLFWADDDQISFANLDNSGGGVISTPGATVNGASGVAIDRTTGRIYWANSLDGTHAISSAMANGSGFGADLDTTGAAPSTPEGPTLDVAGGTVYWANQSDFFMSHASLAGGGGGEFSLQVGNFPIGTALDLAAGRLYTPVNSGGGRIDIVLLDDSGVGNLLTPGATKARPEFPSLLKKPLNTGPPHIAGTPAVGNQLACSHGMWAADNVGALLYRMPQSFTYAWLRNGAVIDGQTAFTYTVRQADAGKGLRCRVTAKNAAGQTAKASAAVRVG